jgi:hypothetical protein
VSLKKPSVSKTRINLRPLRVTGKNLENDIRLQISPTTVIPVSARERVSKRTAFNHEFGSFDHRSMVMKSVQEEHIGNLFSRPGTQLTASQ